ncbi:HaeIII family restriction endonuclease [Psychroflexus montanilacus]|uniref:HaeIII family restriction endonuclease n=1 Tax=Psychroflexus montanilacus TaxID=2873598 RepID=UPI001CCEB59B|nr:HaeIII family restriction endonuclease [Psychroflexus montanilacus]MBZ9652655.1 HaeIII family restriction endonuclease [Psychroflexus montanilacus]
MASQTINGKAFEYSLLIEFYERLNKNTSVSITKNEPYKTAKSFFESFNESEQDTFRITASASINFLLDIEPKLSNGINEDDILVLELVSDQAGQTGDVRDVLMIRSLQKWEIGISAKNNHRAVKHSRLSNKIDFGEKWLGVSCSDEYFNEINPVFDMLSELRAENKSTKWTSIQDMHQVVYIPILNAFRKELLRLDKNNPNVVAENLVQYLIGNQDFYKVIKGNKKVEIQAYNLHGSLNLPFEKVKPKAKIPKLKLPSRLIEIVYQKNSTTTLLVSLNEGWQISFRIHNASSRVEPSLKFDINLVSAPHTLFTNHIFINSED